MNWYWLECFAALFSPSPTISPVSARIVVEYAIDYTIGAYQWPRLIPIPRKQRAGCVFDLTYLIDTLPPSIIPRHIRSELLARYRPPVSSLPGSGSLFVN